MFWLQTLVNDWRAVQIQSLQFRNKEVSF